MSIGAERRAGHARGRSTALLFIGLAVGGVLLAACGSASSAPTTTTTAPATAPATSHGSSPGATFTAFSNCLKAHGVTVPNVARGFTSHPGAKGPPPAGFTPPSGSGITRSPATSKLSAKSRAAFTACAKLQPPGTGFTYRSKVSSTAFAAFDNCLKLHGVNPPKPTTSRGTFSGTLSTSNPKYKTAYTACAALLPSRPASTTATTGT